MWSVNVSINLITSDRQPSSASFRAQSLNRLILLSRSSFSELESVHECSVLRSSFRSDSYSAAQCDLVDLWPRRAIFDFLEKMAKQLVPFLIQWPLCHWISDSLVSAWPLDWPWVVAVDVLASQWPCPLFDQQTSVKKDRKEHLTPSRLGSDSAMMLPSRESATRHDGRHCELVTNCGIMIWFSWPCFDVVNCPSKC